MQQYVLPGMRGYFVGEQLSLDFSAPRPQQKRVGGMALFALASTLIDRDYLKARRAEEPKDEALEVLEDLLARDRKNRF